MSISQIVDVVSCFCAVMGFSVGLLFWYAFSRRF